MNCINMGLDRLDGLDRYYRYPFYAKNISRFYNRLHNPKVYAIMHFDAF